jgi:hypothetical protein
MSSLILETFELTIDCLERKRRRIGFFFIVGHKKKSVVELK